ncbi:MAG TPA: VOC family protein [Crenalkalicoccus sp.]|nr:VOC family protein [Crenalkalicoccus sp.]
MAELDHIVLGARSLAAGAEFVAAHLGAPPGPGGRHEGFGTHNLLLGLGPTGYLEVLAPDPEQPHPALPRPFGLDDPALALALEAEPRLIGWAARTPALEAVLARLGPRGGTPFAMRRGDFAWRIAFPPRAESMGGLVPALIQWDGRGVAATLPDSGWRLVALEAEHPEAAALRAALAERGVADVVRVRRSPHARLMARLRHIEGREVVFGGG